VEDLMQLKIIFEHADGDENFILVFIDWKHDLGRKDISPLPNLKVLLKI